jgi:hypothetical protein
MTDELRYSLKVGVGDEADVDEVEELLKALLLDLYEQGDVVSMKVTKHGKANEDEDVESLVSLSEGVDSSDIMKAIDLIRELEKMDDDDQNA